MRFWLLIFMVALALLSPLCWRSITTLHLPHSIRSAIPYNLTHLQGGFATSLQPSTPRPHSTMATSEPAASVPSAAQSDKVQDQSIPAEKAEETLPKLSEADFRVYNRLAVMMDAYHNHFRHTWSMLYKAAETGSRPNGISMRQYLSYGLQLCRQLTMHHTIEEQYVFPELAERMPIFGDHDQLINQHHEIHEGLEKMESYVRDCLYGEKELRMDELKKIMDSFGEVLWNHLDLEVKQLQADSMRRYWTKQEILGMNW
jgi:iron-sulfur cluster repair protein YtfE (RIC family)